MGGEKDTMLTGSGNPRDSRKQNHHPTVKPLSLTKYLATLIEPPTGGRLLVPFSGSGSEMIGALQAGWEYVEGVELTEEYIPIAEARIKYWLEQKEVEDNQPQQTALVYGKIY
jgi:site-specific DNA-methyltransferase (adenine-specific)